ncbi:ABC transporter substrate-binding protein [Actinomadura sp. LD22]|uniref:ABC transporter substrate-binding protein n=1 Tax=Actinomadura physcomitrii TaxID=2650748 RepID=A0A6I4MFA3_9ACTN|nr:ABC transporter substrate-binding protein [Actinomadura physcomitrii]MWA02904.1 ABC transporter substrate-binding protein [Actinomadura physcomitrii]
MNRIPKACAGLATSLMLVIGAGACSSSVAKSSSGGRMTGTVEVGTGVKADLDKCPSTWNQTGGITKDSITLGISAPRSGPLAGVGGLADGVKAWFDHVNATDPVDGKKVEVEIRDDAYDPARTKTNVQDMIASGKIFSFFYVIGTANNIAAQPLMSQACIPQIVGGTGSLDLVGHPDKDPWIQGGLLPYATEADIWCQDIVARKGKGASVSYLAMDNDFGDAYAKKLQECASQGDIKLVSQQRHAPTAPSITNQITTMAASKADVAILGTTSAFCGQGLSGIAASSWHPQVYVSTTCGQVGATFSPIDPDGKGTHVALNRKDPADAKWADDPTVKETIKVLKDENLSIVGTPPDGVLLGRYIEYAMRTAAKMDGGLNRVNLLKVMWHSDFQNPQSLPGIRFQTDGVKDPLIFDSVQIGTYVPPAAGEKVGHYDIAKTVVKGR